MIIGNPYEFSIFTKTIKEWNMNDTFFNGILIFCVDGNIFPKEVVTATLKCEIPSLKDRLMNLTIDDLNKITSKLDIY